MKQTEICKILTFLDNAYPGRLKYPFADDGKNTEMEATWMMFLGEFDYKAVMQFLKGYCEQNHQHPPSAPQIAHGIEEAMKPTEDRITAHEAYEKVTALFSESPPGYDKKYEEAIKNYELGRPYDFPVKEEYITEQYESLPDRVKKTVRSMGGLWEFAQMEKSSYVRHQFIQAYNDISNAMDRPDRELLDAVKTDIKRLCFLEENKNE